MTEIQTWAGTPMHKLTTTYNPTSLFDALTTRGIGFQNQFRFFDELLNSTSQVAKYPPYDILSTDEDKYEIRFALAGFKKEDIEITFKDQVLIIKGTGDTGSQDAYFHKGIAARSFTQSFPLAEYVEVKGASMEDGILTIKLEREIPEEEKPQVIKIK